MSKKVIATILLVAILACMVVAFTACDKDDVDNGVELVPEGEIYTVSITSVGYKQAAQSIVKYKDGTVIIKISGGITVITTMDRVTIFIGGVIN